MIRKLLALGLCVLFATVLLTGCNKEAKVENPKIQGTAPTLPVMKASGGGGDKAPPKIQSE
jgi:hypothetical protein